MRSIVGRAFLYGAAAAGAGVGTALLVRRTFFSDGLRNQVVLITGGSRGLGFALAREFLRHGSRVAICARDKSQLSRAQARLRKHGEIIALPCDVTDRSQVQTLVDDVRSQLGAIDILVNNAGIISVGPLETATIGDFERAMNTMFWGVVHPTLAVLDEMRSRRSGRIAAITSIGGKVSVPHLLPYSCAKFAAVGFCEGLRAEMAPYGVTVTTIAPGLMRTGGHLNAEFKGNQSEESAWFGLGATLPGVSMSAEKAARQVVKAIRSGKSEKILTVQADLLARLNGAFPGVVPNILGLVTRLLPVRDGGSSEPMTGAELRRDHGRLFKVATMLGQRAAHRLNQVTTS